MEKQKQRIDLWTWESWKEKNQYGILMHLYGIQKDGNDDPICKTAKEMQI